MLILIPLLKGKFSVPPTPFFPPMYIGEICVPLHGGIAFVKGEI